MAVSNIDKAADDLGTMIDKINIESATLGDLNNLATTATTVEGAINELVSGEPSSNLAKIIALG